MGVLACDRKGCKNIMCDRYSPKYGYICWECFNELLEVHSSVTIAEFMESEKGSYNYKESDEYIYEVFELR